MRKIVHTFSVVSILAGVVFVAFSCGGFLGFNITDQKSIDKNLKPKLIEMLGADALIVEIRLNESTAGAFSNTIESAGVVYFEPGGTTLKGSYITLSGKTEMKNASYLLSRYINYDNKTGKLTPADGQLLDQMDFSRIALMVNIAGSQVETGGDDFTGVSDFTIFASPDPAKVTYSFTIKSRQESTTTVTSRGIGADIKYTEQYFIADAEGEVTKKE